MAKSTKPKLADLYPEFIFVGKDSDGGLVAFKSPSDVIEHYGAKANVVVMAYRGDKAVRIEPMYSLTYPDKKKA